MDFPAVGSPISDPIIEEFIIDSEEEIEDIYKTKFGNVEDSGTADGDYSTTTFSDSTKTFVANAYVGYVVWIYGGVGAGQYREIVSNTDKIITIAPAFDTAPDGTSTYRITKLGYKDETIDGSGIKDQFIIFQPLINLNALDVDSVTVTPAYVYQYKDSGKLTVGGPDCEVSYFADNEPQLINMKYIYGVYPLPRIIKRLCIMIAAIRTLTAQIAGTYDDFTTVSLPGGLNASKGEPYMNIRAALDYLQGEARGIVYGTGEKGVGVMGNFRTLPSYRPFMLFG